MTSENLYEGREQTKIKHYILREYLERFALIVGSFSKSITYIDCFSGPWNLRSQDFRDSVKSWIEEWADAGSLRIDGLQPRQRVPKLNSNIMLVWGKGK